MIAVACNLEYHIRERGPRYPEFVLGRGLLPRPTRPLEDQRSLLITLREGAMTLPVSYVWVGCSVIIKVLPEKPNLCVNADTISSCYKRVP